MEQQAHEAVEAARLGAVCLGVVHVERAGVSVDLADRMDFLRGLERGFLQVVVLCTLGQDDEAAATDAGDAAGGRQVLVQQRDDILQQMAPELRAVLHADAIELRHVEQRGRVVVAVQAVLVGVEQGIA